MHKEGIVPKVIRKDRNNELFILFPSEALNDKAIELLSTSGEFKDDDTHTIRISQATDNVLETILKTIIADAQK